MLPMPREPAPVARALGVRWLLSVVLTTAAAAGVARLLGGGAGLLVGLIAVVATASGELLPLVQSRSHGVRDELLAWLAQVRAEHADETIDARSHDPFAHVARMLSGPRPETAPVVAALRRLESTIEGVDRQLAQTRMQRAAWADAGRPALIGG